MNQNHKYLKYASIINIGLGILSLPSKIYSTFYFASAFILIILMNEEEEKINNYKLFTLILGIITIPFNIISSILILSEYSKLSSAHENSINSPPVKKKYIMDPELKKIDFLLKLGVGMVLISGILFATTSWSFMTNSIKAIALLLFGLFFLILSTISEKKLRLYRSSYMYWIVSMAFFALTIVGILYFGVWGTYLSYSGNASNLAYCLTFLTILGLSVATYLKYPYEYIKYLIYTCVVLIVYQLQSFFQIDVSFIILSITLIAGLILVSEKEESSLFQFTKFLCFLLFLPLLENIYKSTQLLFFLASFANVINLFYLSTKKIEKEESICLLCIIYILTISSIYNLRLWDSLTRNGICCAFLTCYLILNKFNILKTDSLYLKIHYGMYVITNLCLYLITIFDNNYMALAIATTLLLICIIMQKDIKETIKVSVAGIFEPLSILMIAFALKETLDFNSAFIFIIVAIIYCIIHLFKKESNNKMIYFIATITASLLCIIFNIKAKEVLPALLLFIPSSCLISIHYKQNNTYLLTAYNLLLLSIYNFLKIDNILSLSITISSLIFIWILIVITLIVKNTDIKKINYFVIIVPVLNMINNSSISYNGQQILISVMYLYITFLIIKFFCNKVQRKDIIGLLGIGISFIQIFNASSLVSGLYIGIVGILMILLGYTNPEYKTFYTAGIITTILNILYQLRDLWEKIPFWLYLLMSGLLLIGFVMYKEITKMNKK